MKNFLKLMILSAGFSFASQPFVGEIILTGHTFCPNGYLEASGQLIPIWEYETLFQLIGTTYGGDGVETFALPNLNGRVPIHRGSSPTTGQNYQMGEVIGSEQTTLRTQQIPAHNHPEVRLDAQSCIDAANAQETGKVVGVSDKTSVLAVTKQKVYCDTPTSGDSLNEVVSPTIDWVPATVSPAGNSQPIEIRSPSLAVRYCISLFGIFPSQN